MIFGLVLLVYCFYSPIKYIITAINPRPISTLFTENKFYILKIISKELVANSHYLEERDILNKSHLQTPTWNVTKANPKYKNYVLVIGESMRADYTSLYGYSANTTPFLKQVNGTIFNQYISAAPNTQPSLQRTLYRIENDQFVYTDNIINLANLANFKTYWLSNQGKLGEYDTVAARVGTLATYSFFSKKFGYDMDNQKDDVLLPEAQKALNDLTDQPKLIVLHLIGSHPEFCQRIKQEPKFQLINHTMSCYLQSVFETDDFLARLEKMLKQTQQSYSVIYFSDHGLAHFGEKEQLYMIPNNQYHQNYHVPFVKFSSDDKKQIRISEPQTAFNFINGFAQWLGIQESHLSQKDFFNPKPQKIKVFNWNEMVDFDSLANDPAKQTDVK